MTKDVKHAYKKKCVVKMRIDMYKTRRKRLNVHCVCVCVCVCVYSLSQSAAGLSLETAGRPPMERAQSSY